MRSQSRMPRKFQMIVWLLLVGVVYWIARGAMAIGVPVGLSISIGMLTSILFWYGFSRVFKRFRTVRIMFPESDRALAEDLSKPLPPEPPNRGITRDSEDPRKYIAK